MKTADPFGPSKPQPVVPTHWAGYPRDDSRSLLHRWVKRLDKWLEDRHTRRIEAAMQHGLDKAKAQQRAEEARKA
jgi:hypothetical protein